MKLSDDLLGLELEVTNSNLFSNFALFPYGRVTSYHTIDTTIRNIRQQACTENRKKTCGILFLTITLANISRFYSFYIILIVKKFYMRL